MKINKVNNNTKNNIDKKIDKNLDLETKIRLLYRLTSSSVLENKIKEILKENNEIIDIKEYSIITKLEEYIKNNKKIKNRKEKILAIEKIKEEIKNKYKEITNKNEEDINKIIKEIKNDKELRRKIKKIYSDYNGIDIIMENKFIDLKLSYSSDISVEEYSNYLTKKIGWLENKLTDYIMVIDMKNSHPFFYEFKELGRNLRKDLSNIYEEEKIEEIINKYVEKYNKIIEKINQLDIKEIKLKYEKYNLENLRKIKEYKDKLEKKIENKIKEKMKDIQKGVKFLGEIKYGNQFFKIFVDKNNKTNNLNIKNKIAMENKIKDIESQIDAATYFIRIENNLLKKITKRKKIIVGTVIENKFRPISDLGLNIFNTNIQANHTGHKQQNISASFILSKNSYNILMKEIENIFNNKNTYNKHNQ